jgi:predicted nucleic acid-binding Zn ribbon protein
MRGSAKEALEGVLSSLETAVRIRESLALAYWEQVAGPQAAAASRADSVRDGVLFVATRSSTWSHELSFHKTRLIAELNRRIGRSVIKDIQFRARGVEETPKPPQTPDHPTPEELDLVRLPRCEQTALRRDLEALFETIPDADLRQMIARQMIRSARLRHWRLEHGWQECAHCASLHRTGEDLCPVCRLCR